MGKQYAEDYEHPAPMLKELMDSRAEPKIKLDAETINRLRKDTKPMTTDQVRKQLIAESKNWLNKNGGIK